MKKSTSKINSHFIDKNKHAHFLAQNRQDSITHELIEEGDQIVFCSVCQSVFTLDSWKYIGRLHCNQSQTLKKIPVLRSLSLDKKKIEKRKKIDFYKKHTGGILIAFFVLIGVLGMMAMAVNALTSPATNLSIQGITIAEKHYLNNGRKYYQAQNYTEAERFYIKALNINPSNTEALHLLEQLENEYLLALEEADRFFKLQKYEDAKYWYRKATIYKPNSKYPTKQLSLITQAEAEAPISFVSTEELVTHNRYSILKAVPQEWKEFINKDEKLYFWIENLQKTEVLLSYESGLVELRSLEMNLATDKGKKRNKIYSLATEKDEDIKFGKLLTTFQGSKMPQAIFIYPELFLNEFKELDENQKVDLDSKERFYEYIAVISKRNKIYYYTLDTRGARQINEFSTFHFKKDEEIILSSDGRYFMVQNKDKLLHLYDARSKTLLKSMRTNEHKPFIENAYFDLENNEIVAVTQTGESRWRIGK